MAVEQLSHFRASAEPATPVAGRVYWKKAASDPGFRLSMGNSAGVLVRLDAPTVAEMTLGLGGKQDKLVAGPAGSYYADDLTWKILNKAAVGLGNVDNTSDLNKPLSTAAIAALANKADDNAVVKLTGNQTIAGIKTFSASPVVPTPTTATQAVNKSYVDNADATLQQAIDALSTTATTALKYKGVIDASTNPNYPSGVVGDVYKFKPGGRIGGASGQIVSEGDMVICAVATAAGNEATVGMNWNIFNSNIEAATEVIAGTLRKHTQAEAEAGVSDAGAMSALRTAQFTDKRNVRFDAAQTLTEPNKTQARTNIGAISTADLATYATITGSDAKYVRYDAATTLTEPQKTQARTNIGAITATEVSGNYIPTAITLAGSWSSAHVDGKAKLFGVGTNGPGTGTHFGIIIPNAAGTYSASLAMRNGRAYLQTVEDSVLGSWIELASQPWVTANYAQKATTLAGYGITNAYMKTETYNQTEINNLVTGMNTWNAGANPDW